MVLRSLDSAAYNKGISQETIFIRSISYEVTKVYSHVLKMFLSTFCFISEIMAVQLILVEGGK